MSSHQSVILFVFLHFNILFKCFFFFAFLFYFISCVFGSNIHPEGVKSIEYTNNTWLIWFHKNKSNISILYVFFLYMSVLNDKISFFLFFCDFFFHPSFVLQEISCDLNIFFTYFSSLLLFFCQRKLLADKKWWTEVKEKWHKKELKSLKQMLTFVCIYVFFFLSSFGVAYHFSVLQKMKWMKTNICFLEKRKWKQKLRHSSFFLKSEHCHSSI